MKKSEPRTHNLPALKSHRRALRNGGTSAEAALWTMLRRSQLRGRKFRRQHSIGQYVLDFYRPAERLAVELDGEPHAHPARRDYDAQREAFLGEQGVRVVRFENKEVFSDPERVLLVIASCFPKA